MSTGRHQALMKGRKSARGADSRPSCPLEGASLCAHTIRAVENTRQSSHASKGGRPSVGGGSTQRACQSDSAIARIGG